jgi:hypothetical protein
MTIMEFEFQGATAKLTPLPGCSPILVVHAAKVPLELRRQGVATEAHKDLMASVDRSQYAIILATARDNNPAIARILSRYGWQRLYGITNPKSGKPVGLWVYSLQEPLGPR